MILLATMSIGVHDDGGHLLIDPNKAPWDKLPKKQIKPTLDLLREEIKCRWMTATEQPMKDKEPAPNNWDKNKLMKWLEDHPIAAANDVSFLKKEVAIWQGW